MYYLFPLELRVGLSQGDALYTSFLRFLLMLLLATLFCSGFVTPCAAFSPVQFIFRKAMMLWTGAFFFEMPVVCERRTFPFSLQVLRSDYYFTEEKIEVFLV